MTVKRNSFGARMSNLAPDCPVVMERELIVRSYDATKSSRQRSVKRFPSKATMNDTTVKHNIRRKGMYDMAVPLGFFMLLLVFAMVLVLMKVKGLEDDRPQLQEDLDAQMANAMLVSVMRTNAPIGYEGNDKNAPLADMIILNNDGRYDDAIGAAMKAAFGETRFFEMKVYYPDGRIYSCKNSDEMWKYNSKDDVKTANAEALLPENGLIKITFEYIIPSTIETDRRTGDGKDWGAPYVWSSSTATKTADETIKDEKEQKNDDAIQRDIEKIPSGGKE